MTEIVFTVVVPSDLLPTNTGSSISFTFHVLPSMVCSFVILFINPGPRDQHPNIGQRICTVVYRRIFAVAKAKLFEEAIGGSEVCKLQNLVMQSVVALLLPRHGAKTASREPDYELCRLPGSSGCAQGR